MQTNFFQKSYVLAEEKCKSELGSSCFDEVIFDHLTMVCEFVKMLLWKNILKTRRDFSLECKCYSHGLETGQYLPNKNVFDPIQ